MKRLLVACEESQRVCTAFREVGWEAYSCDIIECSGGHPEWHIQQDVLPLLNGNCTFKTIDGTEHTVDGKWDMIIAHPPCTYLSNAGARHLFRGGRLNLERYYKGLCGKALFMAIVKADCEKIIIENPVPSSIYELPEYTQIIEPYMFGHSATKKTCLWLKGVNLLKETDNVGRPQRIYFQKRDGSFRTNCWTMQAAGKDRAKERSRTFQGIAKAMAEQWGKEDFDD